MIKEIIMYIQRTDNDDFREWLGQDPEGTGIQDVLEWIDNKLGLSNLYDLEDIFPKDVIKEWAESHDYHDDLANFSDRDLKAYVSEYFTPDEVFSDTELSDWALNNGFSIKND
jgi:hypothetical protein